MSLSAAVNWRPTTDWTTLQRRSALLHAARVFFRKAEFLEVETPMLSHETVIDTNLDPIAAKLHTHRGSSSQSCYLQTSPEFGMKRLLADLQSQTTPLQTTTLQTTQLQTATHLPRGIYQVCRAFRDAEIGRLHNPEFTMIEWYRVGETYQQQMDFTESLVRNLRASLTCEEPSSGMESPDFPVQSFTRLTYDEACERAMGCRLLEQSPAELMLLCRAEGIEPPVSLDTEDRDSLLNLLLAEKVEPTLGNDGPEFLYDYPASQSALARVRHENSPVAERFELYWRGVELCNGYQELTDPGILKSRMIEENRRRVAEGAPELPAPGLFIAAMESGLPECSGVALGFDRLVMLLLGFASVSQVWAFPADRA